MDLRYFLAEHFIKTEQMAVMLSRAVDALGMKIVKTTLNGVDVESAFGYKGRKIYMVPVLRLFIRTEKSGNIRCCARYGNYPDRAE